MVDQGDKGRQQAGDRLLKMIAQLADEREKAAEAAALATTAPAIPESSTLPAPASVIAPETPPAPQKESGKISTFFLNRKKLTNVDYAERRRQAFANLDEGNLFPKKAAEPLTSTIGKALTEAPTEPALPEAAPDSTLQTPLASDVLPTAESPHKAVTLPSAPDFSFHKAETKPSPPNDFPTSLSNALVESRRPTQPASQEPRSPAPLSRLDLTFQKNLDQVLYDALTHGTNFQKIFQLIDTLRHRLGQIEMPTDTHPELNFYERTFTKLTFADSLLSMGEQKEAQKPYQIGKLIAQATLESVASFQELLKGETELAVRVQHFWRNYINRLKPIFAKNSDKSNLLPLNPDRPHQYTEGSTQDRIIFGDGGSFSVEANGKPFNSFDFLFYFLRSGVYEERRVDKDNKLIPSADGVTRTFFPDRENGTYWVTFINAQSGKGVKIPIFKNELGQTGSPTECAAFRANISARVGDAFRKPIDYKPWCARNFAKMRIALAFLGTPTFKEKEDEINKPSVLPLSLDLADVRIVIEPQSIDPQKRNKNIQNVQNNVLYLNGGNTPYCIQLPPKNKNGLCTGEVVVHAAHPITDAQPLLNMMAEIMDKAKKSLTETESSEMVSSDELQKLFDIDSSYDPAVYTEFLENDEKTKEFGSQIEQSELDWRPIEENGRLNRLYTLWKNSFDIRLTPAILETYACMMTLGIDHAHFLGFNTHNQGLVPILTILSKDLQEKMRRPERLSNPNSDTDKVRLLMEIWVWQMDKNDAESEEGFGSIPVMSVLTEGVRNPLTFTGKIMNPRITKFLTETTLFSNLSTRGEFKTAYQKEHPDAEIHFTNFITAFAKIYTRVFGTIKVSDQKTVINLRSRANDPDYPHPNFQENCQKNLEALVATLEDIGATIPKMAFEEAAA